MTEQIGFIGLGTMGGPMAIRLAQAGHDVVAFDIDPSAVEAAVAGGCRPGADARDCALGSDLLFTSLPRPDHVRAVMIDDGALALLSPGSIWVDLTTNRKELVLELAAQAPEGVTVIDCPVTGAVDGARNGRLTLFAGGSDPDLDRVVPVLENLGRPIRCGTLGSGNVTKLVTNQLWFIHAAAIGEGFALGIANGVEIDVIWDAIKDSVADSFVAHHDAPSIFAGHYDPSFTLGLCMKDLGLTMELAENVGTDLPMTTAAEQTFARAIERYGPAAGELHVAKRIEDDTDLSFHLDGDWVPHWEL